MRAVVQRVTRARVRVGDETTGEIGRGLLVLASAGRGDGEADIAWMVNKLAGLRVFADADDRMNLSVRETQGALLLVSQFTLHGDARKGFRPGFSEAMPPNEAEGFFARFVEAMRETGLPVRTGRFQAMMQVELVNDGPVTILLDSKKTF